MTRLITMAAVVVLVILTVLRWIPRIRGGDRPRAQEPSARDTVICAKCGTKYRPGTTGWICPKCGE